MDRPFVEEFGIQNYGCIRDASFRFGPLHALIGPNDSGKSTVLRALRTMGELWHGQQIPTALVRALQASSTKGNVILRANTSRAAAGSRFPYGVSVQFQCSKQYGFQARASSPPTNPFELPWSDLPNVRERSPEAKALRTAVEKTQLLRLDPDSLRTPCPLIPEGQPLRFQDEHGLGLPAIYDAIVTRDVHAFLELNTEIQKLFPDVKSIALLNPDAGHKAIGVKLVDGTLVPAELMSEGLLYYLAFAALRFMDPPAILLIEEPENGLHPARIAEVMRVLREISKTIQVILATHSPLVVNELQPDEVTVVTRTREEGTKAVLLKDTPNFEERSKVYALGELWLSYADGNQEEALLKGGPRP